METSLTKKSRYRGGSFWSGMFFGLVYYKFRRFSGILSVSKLLTEKVPKASYFRAVFSPDQNFDGK